MLATTGIRINMEELLQKIYHVDYFNSFPFSFYCLTLAINFFAPIIRRFFHWLKTLLFTQHYDKSYSESFVTMRSFFHFLMFVHIFFHLLISKIILKSKKIEKYIEEGKVLYIRIWACLFLFFFCHKVI